jgi:hypothetical protein
MNDTLTTLVELAAEGASEVISIYNNASQSHAFYLDAFLLDTSAIRFYAHTESKPALLFR